jgi:hypothetical protein
MSGNVASKLMVLSTLADESLLHYPSVRFPDKADAAISTARYNAFFAISKSLPRGLSPSPMRISSGVIAQIFLSAVL